MNSFLKEIQQGENQKIEFKTTFQKEVIESVVAFANTKGGKVFIGISDSGEVVGTILQPESLQNWINQIKTTTEPSIIVDMQEIVLNEKKL
jgi:ATP-dependent DNA helicase RecG